MPHSPLTESLPPDQSHERLMPVEAAVVLKVAGALMVIALLLAS
jgi:hypothetical protein